MVLVDLQKSVWGWWDPWQC